MTKKLQDLRKAATAATADSRVVMDYVDCRYQSLKRSIQLQQNKLDELLMLARGQEKRLNTTHEYAKQAAAEKKPATEEARLRHKLQLPFRKVEDAERVAESLDLLLDFSTYVSHHIKMDVDVAATYAAKVLHPTLLERSFLRSHG